jgi:hypothetical protein
LAGFLAHDGAINTAKAPNMSHAQDFDFFIGDWHVAHRRLRDRLVGSNDWQTFEGTCTMRPLLGGLGNVDDNLLRLPDGPYRAVSLRSFDANTQRWAIWWLDARHPHSLDVPVVGGFENGVGTFYADDTLNGQAIRVRFRWTQTQTAAPIWDQAFSADAGQTWEANWTMRFSRTA